MILTRSNIIIAEDTIWIMKRHRMIRLPLNDICYFDVRNGEVTVHLNDETHSVYCIFDKLAESLPDYFYRFHRSYIVNLRKIKELAKCTVFLEGGDHITVSQAPFRRLRIRLIEFLERSRPEQASDSKSAFRNVRNTGYGKVAEPAFGYSEESTSKRSFDSSGAKSPGPFKEDAAGSSVQPSEGKSSEEITSDRGEFYSNDFGSGAGSDCSNDCIEVSSSNDSCSDFGSGSGSDCGSSNCINKKKQVR